MPDRPNILIVFTDQQTRNALSCLGNKWVKTPAMDSIVSNGVWFDRAYCPSPVCSPSRAAMIAGRMPHEMDANLLSAAIPDDVPTLGEVFRGAGYDTGYAGKWHLPEPFFFEESQADVRGFRMLQFDKPTGSWRGEFTDELVIDQAQQFLREDRDTPFLLVASLLTPHDICYALFGEKMMSPADAADLPPLPENFPRDPDEPQFVAECRQRRHYGNEQNKTTHWSLTRWREYLYTYYRYVEMVDAQIARLLDTLKQTGQADNTIVILTADHGEGVAAHQWVVKLMLYEEEVGVPLAMRWPGRIKPGTSHALASLVDIMPTLCDFAGIEAPRGAGVSLRGAAERGEVPQRPYVISELQPDPQDASKLGRMVRTDRYKYVAFSYGRNPEMLFDHEADPGEMRNLAASTDHTGVLQQHRELLREWVATTGDHFPVSVLDTAENVRG
jgi:arylsulfatase A-like enzyme